MKETNLTTDIAVFCLLTTGFLLPGCTPLPTLELFDTDADTDTVSDSENECGTPTQRTCIDGHVYETDPCEDTIVLIEQCASPKRECREDVPGSAACVCNAGLTGDDCDICVRHVSVNADPVQADGLDWEHAFDNVQAAIDAARQTMDVEAYIRKCQIWVAEGTYHVWNGSNDDTLQLKPNVEVLGGFSGTEYNEEERSISGDKTVLSGLDPEETTIRSVCTVVDGTGADGAVLDGVTITGTLESGCPDPTNNYNSGGMYLFRAALTVRNTIFSNNYGRWGGALRMVESDAILINCVFENNLAQSGGAISINGGSPTITDSLFVRNTSTYIGHAFEAFDSGTVIENTTFADHQLNDSGASLLGHQNGDRSTLRNCSFVNNAIHKDGELIYASGGSHIAISNMIVSQTTSLPTAGLDIRLLSAQSSSPLLINSTFHNSGSDSNLHIDARNSQPEVVNSIFYGNASFDFVDVESSSLTVSHCRLTTLDVSEDPSNFIDDPLFVDPDNQDYRLQDDSPCIDRANGDAAPEFDADGNPRVDIETVDDLGIGVSTYSDIGALEHVPTEI